MYKEVSNDTVAQANKAVPSDNASNDASLAQSMTWMPNVKTLLSDFPSWIGVAY